MKVHASLHTFTNSYEWNDISKNIQEDIVVMDKILLIVAPSNN